MYEIRLGEDAFDLGDIEVFDLQRNKKVSSFYPEDPLTDDMVDEIIQRLMKGSVELRINDDKLVSPLVGIEHYLTVITNQGILECIKEWETDPLKGSWYD